MAIDPNLITTIRAGELPTAVFNTTDVIVHEVGTDLKSGTLAELIAFIAPLVSAIQFEVKRLHVNALYITNNFDGTGLGINLMAGFAICNGNNGTTNIDGLVSIPYGAVNNVVGQGVGSTSKTINIPIVGYGIGASAGVGNSGTLVVSSGIAEGSEFLESLRVANSSASTSVNVMQPGIVELHIMKL